LIFAAASGAVHAADVLLNGGLEDSSGPVGWSLAQFIGGASAGDYNGNGTVDAADYVLWRNGGPLQNEVVDVTPGEVTPEDYDAWRARFGNTSASDPVSAVEHIDAANHSMPAPGQLGLFLKPQAGNIGEYDNQNRPVNVILTQTYRFGPSAAGRTYTFTGHSHYQLAASNNLEILYNDAPNGPVESPTETYFQMEFLDDSDAVLGDPVRLDLPKNRTEDVLPDDSRVWQMHSLMGTAPAGTTKIRVTAAALDMVASCTNTCPAGQDVYFDNFRLRDSSVPNLERLTNGSLDTPGAPAHWTLEKSPEDNVQFSTADYARHNGRVGMWLRAFSGGDATILQTVPAAAGGNYTFRGWSKWESGYNGAVEGSSTETFLKMEFLDSSNAVIGTPATLDLRTVQMPDNMWREFPLSAVAPAGTVNVRVSAGAAGMMATSGPQSAMFDDFSLELAGAGTSNLLAGAVPEPSAGMLAAIAVLGVVLRRKNRLTM
jgi:hypothetical protein